MHWDQSVLMPAGGAEARSAHLATLTRLHHEKLTSDELARSVEETLSQNAPDSDEAAMARVMSREIASATKLPIALVERKSKLSSEAYSVWRKAKPANDFASLAPYLLGLFDLAGETATCLGYTDHIYDPLIDLYEEGATYADARGMFDAIKDPIVSLVSEIQHGSVQIDSSALTGDWDQNALRGFTQRTASKIGFRFDQGRLDLSANAFCSNMSYSDVRMTTRPSEHIKGVVSSSLHEMGHALYEQNSNPIWDRSPLAGGTSLAVHESQSRLWENIIGRSQAFWQQFFPDLASSVPSLAHLGADGFWRAFTKIDPTFVRVGSDELTYNLHILVRFELEVEILTGKVAIKDLPEAWNDKYTRYLGITPPTDTLGCLQDVHWSHGSVGYFPTYAMGNLIGGQIWKVLRADLGDIDRQMASGDFGAILGWLTEKLYCKGRKYPPRELVTQVTGRPMEAADWLAYATDKYRRLYAL